MTSLDEFNERLTRTKEFEKELAQLINRYSMENGSNTPDYILAEYLVHCLDTYNYSTKVREAWYGRFPKKGEIILQSPPTQQS